MFFAAAMRVRAQAQTDAGRAQGLLGSAAYANEMADQGTSIIAMFNGTRCFGDASPDDRALTRSLRCTADMLGYRIPNSSVTLGMKDRYITEWLLSAATAAINLYVPTLGVEKSSSCCSDYKSFWEAGYPAIGFFENPTTASNYPDYHTVRRPRSFSRSAECCGRADALRSRTTRSPTSTLIRSRSRRRPCWPRS